ncbi:MAG: FtsK/SpoIIIE domain-containing protein [Streptosporangiaceae bacterium]
MVNQRTQMRRHARKMRHYGIQPMTMISPGDQFPDVAAVLIGRWLWRYRSEMAPLAVALTLALVGWMSHARYPGWWPVVAGAGGPAALILAAFGARFGLVTLAERIYAAAVAAAMAGWLAAATVVGPARPPVPQVLATGGLVLAVPWWAHRRRRAKVRVERTLAAWPEVAQAVGLAGSRVQSAAVDVWGWRARIALARGQTIADVTARLPAIESGLGTFRGAVRAYPTVDDKANRFELRVLTSDPHADAIAWPGPSGTSITEPIDIGPFEDATAAKVLLLRRHSLLGGATGSGKSGGLNVVMGNLAACRDVVIWAIDLKRGMELQPWAPCIARLATTPAEARALLADAVTVLEARAAHLAATGQRVWDPSEDLPALVIIVDEYAELAETAPAAAGDADSIARRGRAVAVTLIAATQRPTQKAMGQGALRSQMDVRVSFRVRERKDVDLILGQGMLAAGWHAHTLNAPGKFLVSAPEHDTPRRARAYLLTDQTVAAAASSYAALRPLLDEISMRALEESAQIRPDEPGYPGMHAYKGTGPGSPEGDRESPGALLWFALCVAPAEGASIAELMSSSGMNRTTLYRHLTDHARAGRAIQVSRGRWRAVTTGEIDAAS